MGAAIWVSVQPMTGGVIISQQTLEFVIRRSGQYRHSGKWGGGKGGYHAATSCSKGWGSHDLSPFKTVAVRAGVKVAAFPWLVFTGTR